MNAMQSFEDTPEYYRARENHEMAMAASAPSETIGKIHLVLAEKYRELAEKAERLNDN